MKISRWISLLLALFLVMFLVPGACATEETTEAAEVTEETKDRNAPPETSGTCGEGLTWEINGSTLTVTGSGAMADGAPWKGNEEKIKTLILDGGVTAVGARAFEGFEKLEAIDFGSSLKEIGEGAFRECTGIKSIRLPDSFRLFGKEAFFNCTSLETIHCDGPMPSFKGNCLWTGNHIVIYRPVNNPWPEEAVQVLTDNFGGRLEILAANSDAPAPTVHREVPVETKAPETQPAVPETTAPAQPTQLAPVEETKTIIVVGPPDTETEVIPETTEAAETVIYTLPTMVTQPAEKAEEEGGIGGALIAALLIAGVLTFFIVGALIAKIASRKGRYYD